MRHTIKALGLIITVLWIVTLILPVTVLFSAMKLLEGNNFGIQQPTINFSNGNFSITVPFYINNTGFCDLSEINITVQFGMENKTILTASSYLPNAPWGRKTDSSFNFSLSLTEVISKCGELLTRDANLDANASIRLRAAYIISLETFVKFAMLWGAPFYNLNIHDVSYNMTHATFYLSFDNHAQFSVRGTLMIVVYNSANILVGSGTRYIDISPGSRFDEPFTIAVDFMAMTPSGVIMVYFENVKILEWTFP